MMSFVLTDGQELEGEENFDHAETAEALAKDTCYFTFTEVGTGDIISIASRNVIYVVHHK